MAQPLLSDGFTKFCISTDANVFGAGCKVLVEGQMLDAGAAAADAVTQVSGTKNIDALFGQGSIIGEMLKYAFCACPTADIYALPRKDAAGAVKAVYSFSLKTDTADGAASNGRFMLFLGERKYSVDFPVYIGDKAADIAAELVQEIPADFPYDVSAAAGKDASEQVITFTAKNGGTAGNHLVPIYNYLDKPYIAPSGVSFALTSMTAGSGNPAPAYTDIIGQCCYDCYALGSDDVKWQRALQTYIASAWDCSKPQCFGHGYVYNTGTAGAIAAGSSNAAELSRLAISDNDPILPYLRLANYAALSCCKGCANPEVSVQGQEDGLLSCVYQPQSCKAEWSYDETQYLQDQGFVVSGPSAIGIGGLTHPYIYNDITNYKYDDQYRENATFRDVSSRRLMKAVALSLAQELQSIKGVALFSGATEIRRGTIGTTIPMINGLLRAWAKANVGVFFGDFVDLDKQLQVVRDSDVQPPCQGKPGRILVSFAPHMPVRIEDISTSITPQMLDNCDK